ncbi:hypothetical protein [Flammeovirga aprica]|uniref:Uncharacterized protein n=1 Tax=Flammeovirga aprica JL-4 TaxID=694437 RepID=A0A7X9RY77_9BACT|nr:hypothetical protein [Flammeovirga aprica]NME70968.1 hypothetical protein [Flammeovirga aprica JL-4]
MSCNFFGLDQELDHFTIQNLQLTSNNSYYYLTPPNTVIERLPYTYSNTRDSVFQKLQIENTRAKKVSFNRINFSVSIPSDSTLNIIETVDVFLSNTKDQKTRVGYLSDLPANISDKSLDLFLTVNSDSAGLIMQADTVYFITEISLKSTVRSDSLTFLTAGEFVIGGQ